MLVDIRPYIRPGVTLHHIDQAKLRLIVDRYGAEIVRLAVKTGGTGTATTDKIWAGYGLNDISPGRLVG